MSNIELNRPLEYFYLFCIDSVWLLNTIYFYQKENRFNVGKFKNRLELVRSQICFLIRPEIIYFCTIHPTEVTINKLLILPAITLLNSIEYLITTT